MNEVQYNKAKILYKEGFSLREIEKKLNINRKLLSKKFKIDGIEINHHISKKDISDAINLIESGINITNVSELLKIDRHTLSKKLNDLNVKKPRKSSRITIHDKTIDYLYKSGNSMTRISSILGVSTNLVRTSLREQGYNINCYRKDKLNESIFEKIDSEEKAYWLGFLYADGYVFNNGLELSLCEKDFEHLNKFKLFINSNIELKYKEKQKAYKCCIYSVKISTDLMNLGCIQNKSLILKFPTKEQVPNYLIHHFMRGYFDGDGCIFYHKPKNANRSIQRAISIIGTKEFLDVYDSILLSLGVNKTKYGRDGKAYNVNHGGNLQVQKIFNFLYNDCTIYLQRKYDKFKLPS